MDWKDTSSYSRDDKERKQHWWTARVGSLRISIGDRHRDYPDGDTWLMDCDPWFNTFVLKATNLEDAKTEALDNVRKKLTAAINALDV